MNAQPFDYEIVVVNDGSIDSTEKLALEKADRFPNIRLITYSPNQGKGFAVKKGMSGAKGEIRIMYDADGSTPIEMTDRLINAIKSGADVAIGSRTVSGAVLSPPQPPLRRYLGRLFSLAVRIFVIPGISDTQCGFKAFRSKVAEEVFPRLTLSGFAFDVEALALSRKLGYRVVEVGIHWNDSEGTTVKAFSHGLRMFLDILRVRKAVADSLDK